MLEKRYPQITSLQRWLNHHGSNLTQLHITSAEPLLYLTALPCIKLQDLQLHTMG